jgi:tetratricopeptide (TPR) repeat protein
MKPTIIFFGNCHMGVARNALGRIGELTDHYELISIRYDTGPAVWNREIEPAIGRCAYFFGQIHTEGQEQREAVTRKLPSGCRKVTLAPSFLNSFWPFVTRDERNDRHPSPLGDIYPNHLCNRLILDFLRQGDAPEVACRRFLETDIRPLVDLDRLHEIGLAQLRRLERGKDITLAGFIADHCVSQRLFLMPLHPTGNLFAELCRQMVEIIGLRPSAGIRDLLDDLRQFHGVGAYDAPIHPQVAEHFGLKWADGLRYRHFHEGDFSHDELALRYARFDFGSGYYEGLHLFRIGQSARALERFAEAARVNPRSRYIALTFARLALDMGKIEEALGALDRVVNDQDATKDAELWATVSRGALAAGAPEVCEGAAQRAIALKEESAEAWRLLSLGLGLQGRTSEANAAARRHQWLRTQPVLRPLVEDTGADFGRHWLGWSDAGF